MATTKWYRNESYLADTEPKCKTWKNDNKSMYILYSVEIQNMNNWQIKHILLRASQNTKDEKLTDATFEMFGFDMQFPFSWCH